MKAHELRELSTAELEARLKDEKEALQHLRFSRSVNGQLENPARIKNHKKEVARLLSVLNEKKVLDNQ